MTDERIVDMSTEEPIAGLGSGPLGKIVELYTDDKVKDLGGLPEAEQNAFIHIQRELGARGNW